MNKTSLSRWSASMAVGPQYKEASLEPSSDTAICAIWSWTQTEDGKWPALAYTLQTGSDPKEKKCPKDPTNWLKSYQTSKEKQGFNKSLQNPTNAPKIQQKAPKSNKSPQNPTKAPKIQQKHLKSNKISVIPITSCTGPWSRPRVGTLASMFRPYLSFLDCCLI